MYQGTTILDIEAEALYQQLERIRNEKEEDNDFQNIRSKKFSGLDDEAQQIYKDLAICEINSDSYVDEQLRLNEWRMKLMDFAHTLSSIMNTYRLGNAQSGNQPEIDQLMDILDVLAEIPSPDSDKKLVIRHRGVNLSADRSGTSHMTDYVISVGNVMIDKTMLDYLVKAKILLSPDLVSTLDKTFNFFHLARIHIIELRFNQWHQSDKQIMRDVLHLWGEYLRNCKTTPGEVIFDQHSSPDANLSLLAGLNRIKIDQFNKLVTKIDLMMNHEVTRKKFSSVKTIYEAIFLVDKLKSKLVRPPLEINNSRYIQMWRDCFDENGSFNRSRFNRYRADFLNWENAFYLFWMDLKSVAIKEDRITLLNCIVKYVKDSNMIHDYLEYILKDFFYYPLHLHFSDISSLIFTNMLLFKNFMNKDYDFGRTPEEVLKASEEKNTEVVKHLHTKISNEWSDRFYEKLKTIEKNLNSAIKSKNREFEALSIHILVNLLREALIFLTLTDSTIVQNTLRDTVEKCGNSRSEMYHSANSTEALKDILQLLQTSIRCLAAFGEREDIQMLQTIKVREEDFLGLKKGFLQNNAYHRQTVKKLMAVVDEGIRRLS